MQMLSSLHQNCFGKLLCRWNYSIASQPLPVIIYAGKRGSGVLPQNDSFSSINLISELTKKFAYKVAKE